MGRFATAHTYKSGGRLEYFNARMIITFLKMWKVGNWSVRMVLIPCIDVVFNEICREIFLFVYSKVRLKEFVFMWRDKISDLLTRFLHEFLGLVWAIILTVFFLKINIVLLLDESYQKIIQYFIIEWK
jgi:hypothetical protein